MKRADGQVASPDEKRNPFCYLKTSPEIIRPAAMLKVRFGKIADILGQLRARDAMTSRHVKF